MTDGAYAYYAYIRLCNTIVRVQTAAGDERSSSSGNYEGNPDVCALNWAKCMIITNLRALSDPVLVRP